MNMKKQRGFTLVELLVVITIGILMAILLPALSSAQRNARMQTDKNLLRQVWMGWDGYASSNGGDFPTPAFMTENLSSSEAAKPPKSLAQATLNGGSTIRLP